MKLACFEDADGPGYGAVVDGAIARLDRAIHAPADLTQFIAVHSGAWPTIGNLPRIALDSVQLRPPLAPAAKVLCVASNFREGKPDPDFPLVFTRFADSFVGHASALEMPAETSRFDFEGELAVIIGKPGRRIPPAAALDHVAGYCCLNDGSVRDWQKHSSQFIPGKNFHRSGSLGPWIVTADEAPPIGTLALETRVNGIVKQAISMDRMIFDVAWLIAYFSTFTPLSPGDVIATGTPSGFGSTRNPPEFLAVGDIVEVEIPGIGVLSNAVAAAA